MNEHSTALLSQAKEIRRIANDLIFRAKVARLIDAEDARSWAEIRKELSYIEVLLHALRARFGE